MRGYYGSSPRAWSRRLAVPVGFQLPRFISTCVEQTSSECRPNPCRTVHLHVRGADSFSGMRIVLCVGSSPRAWSRPCFPQCLQVAMRFISTCVEQTLRRRDGACCDRFISTCVEQTPSGGISCNATAVHLHVRGADCSKISAGIGKNGSSPRAWSRQAVTKSKRRVTRFISTCVEQTYASLSVTSVSPVHLHVRGADLLPAVERGDDLGSSPRAWSRQPFDKFVERSVRFISTCVEQTVPGLLGLPGITVHLHVRGADLSSRSILALLRRFISTCVEQTNAAASDSMAAAVHLHVRGADLCSSCSLLPPSGSSPRAWSRLLQRSIRAGVNRFISTCVEQTESTVMVSSVIAVHLHVRGADLTISSPGERRSGSSPRAWSRRHSRGGGRVAHRFISTCVEQTRRS